MAIFLAIAATWAAQAGAAGSANSAGCFHVFDALLYVGKPDLRSAGMEPISVEDPHHWLAPGQVKGDIPTLTAMRAKLARKVDLRRVVVLDAEDWGTTGSAQEIERTASNLKTLADRARSAGISGTIGIYSNLPIRDYWRAVAGPGSDKYRQWQAENDGMSAVVSSVDALFPSLYTFYPDEAGWVEYAKENIAEARRLAPGKPIYAFIWPQFHDSNKLLGGTPIPAGYWALQLQTLAQVADGVVIWGGYQLPWDKTAGWWQATQAFLESRPGKCTAPEAPKEVHVNQ